MDDAQRLDLTRRGKRVDAPALPLWALALADERPGVVSAWIARWANMTGTNFRLVEFDLLDYVRTLEATVQAQRQMMRDAGVYPGVMVEDDE